MTLAKALLAFQQNAPSLIEDSTNPHFRNKYLSLPRLMHEVIPALNKHGLVLMQHPTALDGQPALRTKLVHADTGESEEDVMLLATTKPGPQEQGSALTYARRYAAMAVLGLVADEDDDGNNASSSGEPNPARAGSQARESGGVPAAPASPDTSNSQFQPPTGATDPLGLDESRADSPSAVLYASDKQKAMIKRLAKKLKVPSLPDLDTLAKRDASSLIEELLAKERALEEDIPF